jgi:hypothetical protein
MTPLWSISVALLLAAAALRTRAAPDDVGAVRAAAYDEPAAAGAGTGTGGPAPGAELLDVVLLASVDGRFHALNRATGQTLWSTSPAPAPAAAPALAPLVRTLHAGGGDPDLRDGDGPEQYIIEPQSGDIYLLATPRGALQRLPFSMRTLVDMSPYSFSSAEDRRVFVAKKETSLLVLELETGRLLRTISTECPWEFEEPRKSRFTEEDLDDLEDAEKPPPQTSTHIYIGRTGASLPICCGLADLTCMQTTTCPSTRPLLPEAACARPCTTSPSPRTTRRTRMRPSRPDTSAPRTGRTSSHSPMEPL